jgi:hypothetical protein
MARMARIVRYRKLKSPRFQDVSPCCCPSFTLFILPLYQLNILFILQGEEGKGEGDSDAE